MTDSRWAVLLCKFSADLSATLPVDHYKRLFTGVGAGSLNMTDYFSDMSHGQLDLTHSQVFGWMTIPIKDIAEYNSFDAKHAANAAIPGSRNNLIAVAKQTAAAQGIPLQNFAGLVICVNGPMDYFGVIGGMTAVFDSVNGLRPSVMGQEMGHGYGLDHSRRDGSLVDYQDPWDTMSTDTTPFEQASSEYGSVGPGLNAANMRSRGWLDETRVWSAGSADIDTTVQLRPLHRRDLPGFLAVDIGGFLVEYRRRERWDGAFARSAVFVHRFDANHSYVMPGTKGNYDLVGGDKFQIGDTNALNPFGNGYLRVEVLSIDDASGVATLGVARHSARLVPQIVGTLIGGVANDGGGWVIVNGILHRVPPYDPGIALLGEIGGYFSAAGIRDVALRQAAQRSALDGTARQVAALGASLDAFRAPGKALERKG